MPRLTKTLVEAAIPAGKEAYLWDSEIRGFGLKVLPSGKRVYLVQYRPKGSARTRRFTLGPHSQALTTDKARGQAAQLMARVALGEDPVQTLQQARVDEAAANAAAQAAATRVETELFTTVVVEFIEKHAKRSNKRWDEAQRILNSSDLDVWKERAISSITKRDVRDLIDEVTERSEGAARLLFAHLRKLFNWCVERLYLETSPFAGLKSPKLRPPRDRVLSDQEITDVWKACASLTPPFGSLVRLLLLTGQRREEVTAMKWCEIDRTRLEWTIPAERSKNGRKHEVDLCPLAVSILDDLKAEADRKRTARRRRRSKADPGVAFDEDLVFTTTGTTPVSGHAKAKKALDEAIAALRASSKTLPMAAWRIHDLRRSAATGMARLGFAPHIVEGVLNHLSGARAGIVGTYQLYDLRPERLKALQAWGAHVENLVGRRGGEQVGQPRVHLAEQ